MTPMCPTRAFAIPWSDLGRRTAFRVVVPSPPALGALVDPWQPLVEEHHAEPDPAPESPRSLRAVFGYASPDPRARLQPGPRLSLGTPTLQPVRFVLEHSDPDVAEGPDRRPLRPSGGPPQGFRFQSSMLPHVGKLSAAVETSGFGCRSPGSGEDRHQAHREGRVEGAGQDHQQAQRDGRAEARRRHMRATARASTILRPRAPPGGGIHTGPGPPHR